MNGHINDENNVLIGITSDEDECGHMVIRQHPSASGVTYARNNKTCWAGTANSIQLADGFRACLFNGRCDFIFENKFDNFKFLCRLILINCYCVYSIFVTF